MPMPPVATTALPWDAEVPDPVAALRHARDSCGDTFAVVSGATTYLFLFSPEGVRSFYALPEEHASKGVADWLLLSRKLPEELFDGRRTMPHVLFDRDHVQSYLHQLDWAVDAQYAELGADGIVDVFTLTRRLGHRLGLACWAGAAFTDRAELDRLVVALDELDGAAAFVHPGAMTAVSARGKDAERAALVEVEALLARVLRRRDADPPAAPELFDEIIGRWSDESGRTREIGIAHDVALVHIASMSNLFAALGWMLVDLLERPHLLDRIRAGDRDLAERCALESTRLAQRSIMMRSVLAPVEVADEHTVYHVAPAAVVATFLPLTNTERGTRPRRLRPRSLAPSAPARRGRALGPRAGDRVRPRQTQLPGPIVLARCHDALGRSSRGAVRPRARVLRPTTGCGPDRRRGAERDAVPDALPPPRLTSPRRVSVVGVRG